MWTWAVSSLPSSRQGDRGADEGTLALAPPCSGVTCYLLHRQLVSTSPDKGPGGVSASADYGPGSVGSRPGTAGGLDELDLALGLTKVTAPPVTKVLVVCCCCVYGCLCRLG